MNRLFAAIPLAFSILFSNVNAIAVGGAAAPVKLRIIGEIDTTSSPTSLYIFRDGETPKNPTAKVPVIDGKIDYRFEVSEPDIFKIVSMHDMHTFGTWLPLTFFAEDGEIRITGKEDSRQMLEMVMTDATGPLNRQEMNYTMRQESASASRLDSISDLMDQLSEDELYSREGKAFWNEFNALEALIEQYPDSLTLLEEKNLMFRKRDKMLEDKTMYSDRYNEYADAFVKIFHAGLAGNVAAYGIPGGDLFALSILIRTFGQSEDAPEIRESVIDAYISNFRDKFSNTPMGQRMERAVAGYGVAHVGSRYPEYALPDAQGTVHQIKDLIGGKLVLVDLWGSSCLPCRINSRSLKPIYQDFKDKGFEIIGVAREYRNLDGFHEAVEKDGYPWMQLIELDDTNGVFSIHGIPNAMGGTYLVGPDNRILLINPTPDELRQFLTQHFKD